MSQKPYVIDNMISAKSIAARIEQLAAEIEQEFADTDKLVVVGLLRGSFVFIADLVREINLPIEVDFLEVSSYGDAMESSREVRIFKDLRGTIENRDVLIVGRAKRSPILMRMRSWRSRVWIGRIWRDRR